MFGIEVFGAKLEGEGGDGRQGQEGESRASQEIRSCAMK